MQRRDHDFQPVGCPWAWLVQEPRNLSQHIFACLSWPTLIVTCRLSRWFLFFFFRRRGPRELLVHRAATAIPPSAVVSYPRELLSWPSAGERLVPLDAGLSRADKFGMHPGVDTCFFHQQLLALGEFRSVFHRSTATQFWPVRLQRILTSCAAWQT